jgi:cellulose synthase/poly-beta-1,6-N-acetylglucosamine synthase-like glycosyltransferase
VLALLALYGLHRLSLLARFRWRRERESWRAPARWPAITVQLPVYQERTVAARLIRAVGQLRYPAGQLEIQVLDDSTDETCAIVDAEIEELRFRGLDAKVLRRADRTGFKAGALAAGLERARGELVCVFDADFLPPQDFLLDLVGAFEDERVGMVQARWGHQNRIQSLLTRAESTLLDGHFVIEHTTRFDSGLFFNFNGTAGIWRREAILASGGWQHDTLTEDLDLSYRAQLAGWRFVYAPHVVAPAEVPTDIAAFCSQQRRWAAGSMQVARKLTRRLLAAREPLAVKLEALAHLSGNVGYPLVLCLALLMPLQVSFAGPRPILFAPALFSVGLVPVLLFYALSQSAIGRPWRARIVDVLAAVALGVGMSLGQTRAVLAGLRRETGVFVRTPKCGDAPPARRYRSRGAGVPGLELAVAGWIAAGGAWAIELGRWGALPFLALFVAGFGWVGILSLQQWVARERPRRSGRDARTQGAPCELSAPRPTSTP